MVRYWKWVLAFILLAILIVAPIALARGWQQERRHFRTVREGVLYRSGQMSLRGLARTVHDHGIRSVVTFRASNRPGKPDPDADEEAWCREEGIHYLRLAPLHWEKAEGGEPPVVENIKKYLDFLADKKNYPVLIHCFAGIHRTGAYCAIYRMEIEGWDLARALEEMRACGYITLEENEDILGYLTNYKPGAIRPGLPRLQPGGSVLFPYGKICPSGEVAGKSSSE